MSVAKGKVLSAVLMTLCACVGEGMHDELDVTGDREIDLAMTSAALSVPALELDARRSLAITDQPILEKFSFERVMTQLVGQARVPGLTPTKLFQQWWDTQNSKVGGGVGPHCDDVTVDGVGSINEFPYSCRPAPFGEGKQASCDPFKDPACKYIPIGLFNRFDLAPTDGSSCGEYRIVYAKETGITNVRDRNLLIFEASLPNPRPWMGLAGCRPIVSYWAELSRVNDITERASRLERFYFQGFGPFSPPVVDIRHYGDNALGRGQVRTNQFVQDGLETRLWSLREFKLRRRCESTARCSDPCTLQFVPTTVKSSPFGGLFADEPSHAKGSSFQQAFLGQIENLSANTLPGIRMDIEERYNAAQSQASGVETDYLFSFQDGGAFGERIQARLDQLGSALEPIDIVARAQTQSCAGCHRLSNGRALGGGLTWPASLGFTHVTERETEVVDGVTRFRISEALIGTLLPRRKAVMQDFLLNPEPKPSLQGLNRPGQYLPPTIGGSDSHG